MNPAGAASGHRPPTCGFGIELADLAVRGVRIDATESGQSVASAEFPVSAGDDQLVDALVLLNAELGEPSEPARIATLPGDATLQRVDVTGRSDADVVEIRERMRADRGIRSSVIAADGPRRWLLLIRWDEQRIERLRTLAARAGLVDVVVEPSPIAIARIGGNDATYVRRIASRDEAHHAVVQNRVPVAAASTAAEGRAHPDLDIAISSVAFASFDEFLDDHLLAESIDRAATRVGALVSPSLDGIDVAARFDQEALRRHGVALGAAYGAAGLSGPIHPIQIVGPSAGIGGDPFDRPWAIEPVPPGDDGPQIDAAHGIERVTRWFRTRRPQ
ncbi:hypothetical protein [Ilumatobacter nonamiensis]|uniref:hypothetical protein n=1 Tax=Ilumatobacter nonamiensis TaxID=467093 RepID=UPI00034C0EF4|nr:hypothetical protein [Ilumatobacter nonamiensis]